MAYSVVGKSLPRVDAPAKVTGQALYGTDAQLAGMLWSKILRSPLPHARIRGIDPSPALTLAGVKAVITAQDFPLVRYGQAIGPGLKDRTVIARDKVRYLGEPVAAVAAVDEETAEEALDLIRVDYEELPAVFDLEAAMAADAPLVHEDLEKYEALTPFRRYGN